MRDISAASFDDARAERVSDDGISQLRRRPMGAENGTEGFLEVQIEMV